MTGEQSHGSMGSVLDWAQLAWAPVPQPGAELAAATLQGLPWAALLRHLPGAVDGNI